MESQNKNKKNKLYLTVGLIMIIIITAWVLNLKNSFNNNQSQSDDLPALELQDKWNQMSTDLDKIFGNIKNRQKSLQQSPTTTGTTLQGGPQLSPAELDEVVERLKIETSTSTNILELTTTTQIIN